MTLPESPKGEIQNSPKGETGIDQRVNPLTETTTENTTKNTNEVSKRKFLTKEECRREKDRQLKSLKALTSSYLT